MINKMDENTSLIEVVVFSSILLFQIKYLVFPLELLIENVMNILVNYEVLLEISYLN